MIDDQLRAGAVVAILLVGVGLTAQYYYGSSLSQPFSEVGILGPGGKVSGYPINMTVGGNYTLDLYVSNHEGHSMMYAVYEKVGTQASIINQTVPLSSSPIARYYFVLPDNGTATRPITVSLSTPGQNLRLVWELWDYSPSANAWGYQGSWAQLFVNATSPA